jgi:ParB family transcriptional regulator, chromosome partitioning protein
MALGKSLGNILGDYFGESTDIQLDKKNIIVQEIPVDKIKIAEFQTRTHFDEDSIHSLAMSIKENGMIHPIMLIKADKGDEYTLISGERRLRAVKHLGEKIILAIVKEKNSLNKAQKAMLTAVENLQREGLSALEKAKTYKIIMETKGISEIELAEVFNVSRQHTDNYLRLLKTSPAVQSALGSKKMTEGQARFLTTLPHEDQDVLLAKILEKNMAAAEVERLVKRFKASPQKEIIEETKEHKIPQEFVSQLAKVTSFFPKSKTRFQGDEKSGKIIISW